MRKLAEEEGAGGDFAAYEAAMQPIDAINYLSHAAPGAVFLQAGELDTRPSPEDTQEAFRVMKLVSEEGPQAAADNA